MVPGRVRGQWTEFFALAAYGAAAMALLMARLPYPIPVQWLGSLAVGGGLGVLTIISFEPACIVGPFGGVDPATGTVWLDHVFEMKSLYHQAETSPSAAISHRSFEFIAVAILVVMIAATVYSRLHLELMYDAMRIATVPVALLPAIGEMPERSVRIGAAVFCSQTMMLAVVSIAAGLFTDIESKSEEAWTTLTKACQPRSAYGELAGLPAGLITSEIDIGPLIVPHTKHRVVAPPYYRIDKGIIAAHATLASDPDQSNAWLKQLRADYVVVCQRDRKIIYAMINGSLMQCLQRGESNSYLEPVLVECSKSPLRI